MKLEIELVPQSCWYMNLRKVFTPEEWKRVSNDVRDLIKTKGTCSICGKITHPRDLVDKYLEAHEVWEYRIIDENSGIIILKDIIPLCTTCHRSKHFGYSQLNGWTDMVCDHLKKVNNLSDEELNDYIDSKAKEYEYRSQIQNWKLDLSKLKDLGYTDLYEKYKDII